MKRGRPKMKRGTKAKPKMVSGKLKQKGKRMHRKQKNRQKTVVHPWGGCLPNPPIDCPKKASIFKHNGTKWIDLAVCFMGCHFYDNEKGCQQRKDYLEELKTKREAYFKSLKPVEKENKK